MDVGGDSVPPSESEGGVAEEMAEDPREEMLTYCWLMPSHEHRRRLYSLVRHFGLNADQVF
jgi:hypothetical protein